MPSRFVRCLGCCIASLGQVLSSGIKILDRLNITGTNPVQEPGSSCFLWEHTYEFVAHKKKMGKNGPGSLPHSQGRAPLSRGCEAIPLGCSHRVCTPTSRGRRRAAAASLLSILPLDPSSLEGWQEPPSASLACRYLPLYLPGTRATTAPVPLFCCLRRWIGWRA